MLPRRRVTIAAAVLVTVAAVTFLVARPTGRQGDVPIVTQTPSPSAAVATAPVATQAPAALADLGAARTTRTVVVRASSTKSSRSMSRLRPGILLPVLEQKPDWIRVLTPCEVSGWIQAADTEEYPRAPTGAHRMDRSTIVLDPGHGGTLPGAVGPKGLVEKDVNLDIALRLRADLGSARVFLTHDSDYTAGIRFRDAIASSLRADVLVSIHNNADPDGPFPRPGTETYYQVRSAASKRLAGLLYEEVTRAVQGYDAAWVADRDAGAKYRKNRSGLDYYAILRDTPVTAAIAENLFITNAPEEALLARPEVRSTIAEALAHGIDRYITTNDSGTGFTTPYAREPGPSGTLPSVCVDPA